MLFIGVGIVDIGIKMCFCVFEMLDGTDEEVWFDSDDVRECTKIKEVMDVIPTLNENAKLAEQFLKEVAIKKDFDDD